MTRFIVGDQVMVRFGNQQGQKGTITKSLPGDGYRVKLADGFILFFSGKGLQKEEERAKGSV